MGNIQRVEIFRGLNDEQTMGEMWNKVKEGRHQMEVMGVRCNKRWRRDGTKWR